MKDNFIYLDNAATTKPSDEVVALNNVIQSEYFANPNSIHELGVLANKQIYLAKEKILKHFKLTKHKVLFTASSTEANNIAIKGYCLNYKNRGKHIITSEIEHPSVLECFKQLEKEFGFSITILKVDNNGQISLSDLEKSLQNNTILVSIMAINNEIGSINPISKIAQIVHKFPKANLHVDTTQAIGKMSLDYSDIDMFVVSSHKIHGLKGSGALIYKNSLSFLPLISGGGQEDGFRSGTQSVANAVTLAKAIDLIKKEDVNHIIELKNRLVSKLSSVDEIVFNSNEKCSPYIVNFSLKTKKASVVVEALSLKGIYVSSVSACNSKKESSSYVVKAISGDDHRAHNTIRVSFSKDNSLEEIDVFTKELINILETIR